MPSYIHELILLLFRNRSGSAVDLLRELNVQLPEHDAICAESSDLSNLRPAEYRADLVLILQQRSRKVLGLVLEVQLACDEDKRYVWPAYITNLRARHRCPVCLLVITVKETVARWADRPIELGPGSCCMPWVIGPSNMPAVAELRDAKENLELAVLSAVEHGQSTDVQLAARIASAAIVASADVDTERSRLYLDLILIALSEGAPKVLKAAMNSLGYEYQSDFARRYVAQGRLEGRAEGRAEGREEGKTEGRAQIVLRLLALRFGPLSEAIEARVRGAGEEQIDALTERMLTAPTLEDALGVIG